MPQTPIYGFEIEAAGEQPGRTLTGEGGSPVLAEQVEDELERIDSDIADANAAIVVAGKGWVPIVEDSFTGSPPFTVDLTQAGAYPAGTFSVVRVFARGSLTGAAGHVTMRINGDTTADMHETVLIREQGDTGAAAEADRFTGTVWRIGRWGTLAGGSNLVCTVFNTSTANFLSFQAESGSIGSTAGVSFATKLWGRITQSLLLDSLRFSTFDAASDFDTFNYQIEGWVAP